MRKAGEPMIIIVVCVVQAAALIDYSKWAAVEDEEDGEDEQGWKPGVEESEESDDEWAHDELTEKDPKLWVEAACGWRQVATEFTQPFESMEEEKSWRQECLGCINEAAGQCNITAARAANTNKTELVVASWKAAAAAWGVKDLREIADANETITGAAGAKVAAAAAEAAAALAAAAKETALNTELLKLAWAGVADEWKLVAEEFRKAEVVLQLEKFQPEFSARSFRKGSASGIAIISIFGSGLAILVGLYHWWCSSGSSCGDRQEPFLTT
eukprot:gnl/MRDRNA2_/MRDRNA2_65903_c0_seq2.p1 gnl/MRDRNA2_/MRDRNA2_65903_c0~~gnl/MRDRNA2_/MRDRNA2_65903_c0_seq2.p1  ORF type:complete len:271 (-),score=79.98 gnl/MRDRNA2_/MRDRNA2_65903_c0_seq2:45-857(-)